MVTDICNPVLLENSVDTEKQEKDKSNSLWRMFLLKMQVTPNRERLLALWMT